jgi:hypothetical protein
MLPGHLCPPLIIRNRMDDYHPISSTHAFIFWLR